MKRTTDRCVMLGEIPREKMKGDEQRRRVYSPYGICPTLLTPSGGYFETKIMEGYGMKGYWLSDAMQRYIVSKDDKYIVGSTTINPSIAKSITTREGQTRADASSFISPDCPDDCEIVAGEDGYPIMASAKGDDMSRKDFKIANPGGNAKTIVATVQKNHKATDNFLMVEDGKTIMEADRESIEKAERAVAQREDMGRIRIRKLTEGECMRLMGFEKKDTDACKDVGLSKTNVYHQSGDSICTTVLASIFGELMGIDYAEKVKGYADKLAQEKETDGGESKCW